MDIFTHMDGHHSMAERGFQPLSKSFNLKRAVESLKLPFALSPFGYAQEGPVEG